MSTSIPSSSARVATRTSAPTTVARGSSRPVEIPDSFGASKNALEVFYRRYSQKKPNGEPETPEEMCQRVARALAEVERSYGKTDEQIAEIERDFTSILLRKEFTPAGRTLTNVGTDMPTVANCIVLHIEDSMESIFSTLRDAALLQQAGSGLGFPLHLMRPAGSNTKRSQGQASGPISFLRVYNQAFGVIKQQNRHGANMAVMRVDHPDILEFVHAKEKEGEIQNFNISVGLTDKFMQAVKDNDPNPWFCEWKGEKMQPRRIRRGSHETAIEIEEMTMTARQLFEEIIDAAWLNGEPGCVFLDEVNATNPVPGLGRLEACNPCGEQFLHDSDVCNLGSIILERFVTDDRQIDYERLRDVTRISTRMLDNVVDVSDFPAERVNKVSKGNRRIGLGIMGFADMLYRLGVPYNSEQGRLIAEQVMQTIQDAAHEMSRELAEEKSVFPNWQKSVYKDRGIKMRNAALTTIAPTGTISMLHDVSGGVEPYFALAYYYKGILGGDVQLTYVNKHLEDALRTAGVYSDELMARIVSEGSLQHIAEISEEIRRAYVVAMDISAEDHIRMQAAFQRHIDNSISKTVNFPNDATREDVLQGYLLAWELRCKGCTVYRDGSREVQVLNLNKDKKKDDAVAATEAPKTQGVAQARVASEPRERPNVMQGCTYKVDTAYGKMYVTINNDAEGQPFEIFATLGKSGGFFAAKTEAICRLISLSLRSGITADEIIKQLKGIRGPAPVWTPDGQVLSLADAIGKIMEKHIRGEQPKLQLGYKTDVVQPAEAAPSVSDQVEAQVTQAAAKAAATSSASTTAPKVDIADLGHAPACPDCGNMLTFTEGCLKCTSCGFSKCG